MGVVLAGGAGQRLGGDKAFVRLAGRPLIAHVADRLGSQCTLLAVNSNDDPRRFEGLGFDAVVPDGPERERGPLEGILSAMRWAGRRGARRVLTAPVDTPFLPVDLAERLAAIDTRVALAATADGIHGTCGLWDTGLSADLAAALEAGQRKVADWASSRGAEIVRFPKAAPLPFLNINTPDDLAQAEACLDRGS